MISTRDEDYICHLKEVSPRLDLQIRRIQSQETALYYHKRLQQLASAAKEKVLALEGKETLATVQEVN